MKGSACFTCRNSCHARPDIPGWAYDCSLGIDNTNFNDVDPAQVCASYDSKRGFSMGGYYTHMWFEQDARCLTWHIQGDGEFPTEEGGDRKTLDIHICDFAQIEAWVTYWGMELRKRGWIEDETNS